MPVLCHGSRRCRGRHLGPFGPKIGRVPQVSPSGVRQLSDALRAVSEAAATGSALADDETFKPVTAAVRALLGCSAPASGSPYRADRADRRRLDVVGWTWSVDRGAGLVGLAGFEPATSATQTRRASQAALQPVP